MKKICLLLCCLTMILLLPGCGGAQRYTAITFAFDTEITLTAYCNSPEEFQALRSLLFDRMGELHKKFDIYRSYEGLNNLYTLNHSGGAPVALDGDILELLQFGQEICRRTGGRVNIAMGAVLALWTEARDTGVLPGEDTLREAALHGEMEDLVVDAAGGTALLRDPEMSVDVGAIAKGWAAQKAAEAADAAGYTDYVLSAGGNVIVRGQADGRAWRVGVRDPQSDNSQDSAVILEMGDMALVTSGGYERSLTVDGKSYCHIIDPDTGWPVDKVLSATVICEDSALGDGLSTALFLMEPEEGLDFARSQGVRAIIIDRQGQVLDSAAR